MHVGLLEPSGCPLQNRMGSAAEVFLHLHKKLPCSESGRWSRTVSADKSSSLQPYLQMRGKEAGAFCTQGKGSSTELHSFPLYRTVVVTTYDCRAAILWE